MDRKKVIADNISTEANIWKRILAGFIDYLIIFVFTYAYIIAFGKRNVVTGEFEVHNLMILPIIVFWSIMTIGIEQWFDATFGNQIVGLKPLSINGIDYKLSLGQSTKRHLLDIIDLSFFGLIGIVLINKTEKNQRLGDIWAETVVIKDKNEEQKTHANTGS
jgi:uncharacterized RDD family membrane protein YckC